MGRLAFGIQLVGARGAPGKRQETGQSFRDCGQEETPETDTANGRRIRGQQCMRDFFRAGCKRRYSFFLWVFNEDDGPPNGKEFEESLGSRTIPLKEG